MVNVSTGLIKSVVDGDLIVSLSFEKQPTKTKLVPLSIGTFNLTSQDERRSRDGMCCSSFKYCGQ